ncbi:amidase [Candidatus Bathyarchaeota archaeon]|nr:MAG: amidase [Candidatus Bathyarchaeota archaeon]
MIMSNLSKHTIDGIEQALQIKNGTTTPIELVEETIERIETHNPSVNAVITKTYETARETSSKKLPESPLSGTPILIKDLTQVKGVRNTNGSTVFKDNIARYDSEIIIRMKKAGLIILGMTNTPEFGLTCTTEPRLHGPTRNPWNKEYSSGGSSGGASAAVASGMVSIAHGSDGGGSIRTPASFCGLFGLKPTRGRVPHGPQHGSSNLGVTIDHALTRSVRDSAAFLDIIDGFCIGEPYAAPTKNRAFIEEIEVDPGKLRVALLTESWVGGDFHPDVEKVVRGTAEICSELGHNITEIEVKDILGMKPQLFYDSFVNIWSTIAGVIMRTISLRAGEPKRDWVEDLTWGLYQRSLKLSAIEYKMSFDVLEWFGRNLNNFIRNYDVILTATNPDPPFKLGEVNSTFEEPLKNFDKVAHYNSLNVMSNASGNPAMSVPLGLSREGLPIGTQFIGRFGDEATLFRLASQLEKNVPWNSLHC